MKAYEEMIQETATKDAPWYVVPADNKWFTRVVVGAAVIDALCDLIWNILKSAQTSSRSSPLRKRSC